MAERKIAAFGKYPYAADGTKQPVEWIVLDATEKEYLLLSLRGLDAVAYDHSSNNWDISELRNWLNNEFKKEAFSAAEQKVIAGEISILTIEEVDKYFDGKADCLIPTPYAAGKGIFVSQDDGSTWWWLRSQGATPNMAAFVYNDGTVFADGTLVSRNNGAVRPVVRIKK